MLVDEQPTPSRLALPPLRDAAAAGVHSPTKRQKAGGGSGSAAAAERERALGERVEASMNELVKLSDEKLNIATQVRAMGECGGCSWMGKAAAGSPVAACRAAALVPTHPFTRMHTPAPPCTHPTRQIYDYIDRHITKLDKDCKAFDAGGCG